MSDVPAGSFEPWPDVAIHVEWGPIGASLAAARGDIVVVVDALSFSTTVTMAVERGASVLVMSPLELEEAGGRDAVSARYRADVIAKARFDPTARFTLSPNSLTTIGDGDRLVMTSLNGGTTVAAAAAAPAVLIGSLRSATATARAAAAAAAGRLRITIVACGEHWSSVAGHESIVEAHPAAQRPSVEDWFAAGAIVDALGVDGVRRSVEAEAAAAAFDGVRTGLVNALRATVSGRELIAKGFPDDVDVAAALDAFDGAVVQGGDGFFAAG